MKKAWNEIVGLCDQKQKEKYTLKLNRDYWEASIYTEYTEPRDIEVGHEQSGRSKRSGRF